MEILTREHSGYNQDNGICLSVIMGTDKNIEQYFVKTKN